MRKNDLLEEAIATIRAAGFEPDIVRNRHYKVSWHDQHGRRRCIIIAMSPSSRYARVESRAVLRRLLRALP